MRKLLAVISLIGGLFGAAASIPAAAASAHPTYALGKAKACKAGFEKKTEFRLVSDRVKVKGKWKTLKVEQRYVACIWKTAAVLASTPVKTTGPTTTSATAPSSTSSTSTGAARAAIDPTYTQSVSNPLIVTFDYSAGESDGSSLPNGVLSFYWGASAQAQALACSINVGGSVTGGQGTVTLSTYGPETVTTTYVSGTSSATETDTVDIENPTPVTTSTTTTTLPAVVSTSLTVAIDNSNWGTGGATLTPTVTDSNRRTVSSGSVSYSIRFYFNGAGPSGRAPQIPAIVGSTTAACAINIVTSGSGGSTSYTVSSSTCSGGGSFTAGANATLITVQGTYSGSDPGSSTGEQQLNP